MLQMVLNESKFYCRENYSFEVKNKIQSANCKSNQVTLMVQITYMLNPEYASNTSKPRLMKYSNF